MAEGLSSRILMKHRDAQGHSVFTSQAGRRLFEVRGPFIHELILEFFSTIRFGEAVLDLDTAGALQFYIAGRSQTPKKVTVTDLFYLRGMDVGSVYIPYLLALYLRRFASGRKRGISEELDDTWAWVSPGPERQPDAVVGALEVTEGAPDIVKGAQVVLAPVQAPQPPPAARLPQRVARLEEEISYARRTRRRTDDASTSAPYQPDP
uniref:Uncharacterized protein n=1 Tax=Tanacetum cinerariifolium TaxID=118510 RepID=A0A6L2KGN0_TANCI|nr:hypothetical protein [Tanacetum cinerariifolium]